VNVPVAALLNLTQVLIVVLGGSGISAVVALLKFKPDRDAVVVSAAQGALIVQSGVIDALQAELVRARQNAETERAARLAAEADLRAAQDRLRKLQSSQPRKPRG
jgi:NADPH-dependent curcumin reductase CurA